MVGRKKMQRAQDTMRTTEPVKYGRTDSGKTWRVFSFSISQSHRDNDFNSIRKQEKLTKL